MLNNALIGMGWISSRSNILNSDKHVWLTQVLLQQWKGLGWSAIIYFAAISGIDQELYEAAQVDGAWPLAEDKVYYDSSADPHVFVLLIMSIGNFLNNGVDRLLLHSAIH